MLKLGLAVLFLLSYVASPVFAQEYVEGEVIVKLKGKSSPKTAQSFASKVGDSGIAVQKSWATINTHKLQGKSGQNTQELMNALASDPDVEYVEPNYIVKKEAMSEPTAQFFTYSQVGSFVSGFGLTTAPIDGASAWSQVTQNNLPIVAVIDTGIDLLHPALQNAIWVNTDEIPNNGIDDDHNGFVDDRNGWNFFDGNNYVQDCDGHGTHVSGIVRGTTQFIFDPDDIRAPVALVMPVKFLDCYGNGTTASAIDAIYYAVSNGAKVLNNSWGGGGYSRALHEAIVYSYNAKTIFVAAAGNNSNNNDSSKTYPSSYDVPNVLSVAATKTTDILTSFSNFGAGTVVLASPGENILSTFPDFAFGLPQACDSDSNSLTYDGCFSWLSGTSMAAPIVSGVAALMVNEKPTMNGYQVRNLIKQTVDARSSLAGKVQTGGRVNSANAVILAKSTAVDAFQPAYEVGIPTDDRELASALAGGGAGGCGLVAKMTEGTSGSSDGTPPYGGLLILTGLMMIPILLTQKLRKRRFQRRHPRFAVNSHIRLQLQGLELEADLSSISVGGAGFQTQALLENGSIVKMVIEAPDGKRMEVEGRVVWKSTQKSYGVKFMESTSRSAIEQIRIWTRSLSPLMIKN